MNAVGFIVRILMNALAVIQLLDFMFSSILIQDYFGTGQVFVPTGREAYQFMHHLPSPSEAEIAEHPELSHEAMTKYGHSILELIGKNYQNYEWATVGEFDSGVSSKMDM